MAATKQLEFVFKNQSGGNVTLAITNPKAGVTSAEAHDAATKIITANVFNSKGGELVSVSDIRMRVLDVTSLG